MNSDCLFSPTSYFLICQIKGGAGGEPGTPPLLGVYELHQDNSPGTQSPARLLHTLRSFVPPDTSPEISHILARSLGRATQGPHPKPHRPSKQGGGVCVLATPEAAEKGTSWEKCQHPHPCYSSLLGHMPWKPYVNILYPEANCRV